MVELTANVAVDERSRSRARVRSRKTQTVGEQTGRPNYSIGRVVRFAAVV
jgi:hypothetical protein